MMLDFQLDLKALEAALLAAFPTKRTLARMVRQELHENLDAIAGGNNLTEQIFSLIEWAMARGKLMDLAQAALATAPGNLALRALGAQLGLPLLSMPVVSIPLPAWLPHRSLEPTSLAAAFGRGGLLVLSLWKLSALVAFPLAPATPATLSSAQLDLLCLLLLIPSVFGWYAVARPDHPVVPGNARYAVFLMAAFGAQVGFLGALVAGVAVAAPIFYWGWTSPLVVAALQFAICMGAIGLAFLLSGRMLRYYCQPAHSRLGVDELRQWLQLLAVSALGIWDFPSLYHYMGDASWGFAIISVSLLLVMRDRQVQIQRARLC